MTNLVFIDCETTSLALDRRPWEIAIINRTDSAEADFELLMQVTGVDLSQANPDSLRYNRFYERSVDYSPDGAVDDETAVDSEREIAETVEAYTRNAYLVASNPAFDALTLDMMLRRNGLLPAWSYHLIDVRVMALGRLTCGADPVDATAKSDDLARACGVNPDAYERHTALGDARMVRDWFDAITGGGAK